MTFHLLLNLLIIMKTVLNDRNWIAQMIKKTRSTNRSTDEIFSSCTYVPLTIYFYILLALFAYCYLENNYRQIETFKRLNYQQNKIYKYFNIAEIFSLVLKELPKDTRGKFILNQTGGDRRCSWMVSWSRSTGVARVSTNPVISIIR